MAKVNKALREYILNRFIDDNMYGDRGCFRFYKMLQDLGTEYQAMGGMTGWTDKVRAEFFYRFQLISETIFDLETLAAAARNNITGADKAP